MPLVHAKGMPSSASEKEFRARGWSRASISRAAPGPTATRAWGEQLFFEEAGGGVGDVGVGDAYGGEARLEGAEDAGADRLFYDEDDAAFRVARGGGVPRRLHAFGEG